MKWRMGGRNVFLIASALTSVGAIQRAGWVAGLIAACLFGGVVWFIAWSLWLVTETEAIAKRLGRLPGWLIALAWPLFIVLAWALEPDHGVLVHGGPWLLLTVTLFWLLFLGFPVLTLRWFRLRRSARSTPPA